MHNLLKLHKSQTQMVIIHNSSVTLSAMHTILTFRIQSKLKMVCIKDGLKGK